MKKNRRVGVDVALKLSYVLNVPISEIFSLPQSSWFTLVTDSEDLAIYIDHLNLQLINSKGKKEIESREAADLYVNIETREVANLKSLSKEKLSSGKWRPRFERIIKYINPIQF